MKRSRVLVLAISLLGLVSTGRSTETLISRYSTWRYKPGLAPASAPDGRAWRNLKFNDDDWRFAQGPLYYGDPLERGTVLTDMKDHYTSIFLRQKFVVHRPEDFGLLILRIASDDGFVLWINGREVVRYNLPAGEVPFDGLAITNVPEPVITQEFQIPGASEFLLRGENIIAAKAFNVALDSSDFLFDMELLSPEHESPVVVGVDPPPGPIERLSHITVTFSEPVIGLNASDLRINGRPALSVTGGPTVYSFGVTPPAFGVAQISWATSHEITDLEYSGFDANDPTANWQYNVTPSVAPSVAALHPPAGAIVGRLTQVEVTFSEPVTGVQSTDLLINDQPAPKVSGSGAGPYVFEFPSPAPGKVSLVWSPSHVIQDLGDEPILFKGTDWSYTLDPLSPVGNLVLNEFLASNVDTNGLRDEDGQLQGWIEIYNRSTNAVNLDGWSLTDNPRIPGRWIFPAAILGGGQYLVVFASGKDRRPSAIGAKLHTNFKLAAPGEYLALFNNSAPREFVSQYGPEYPEQRNDFSYGLDASGIPTYFSTPTPGFANGPSGGTALVAPVHFNVGHGFFNSPFHLILSTPTPGATIRYTLDGNSPTESVGNDYIVPILLQSNAVVRAAAFRTNFIPSRVETRTYLFDTTPGLLSLPVISIATDDDNLYGETGILGIQGGKYIEEFGDLRWEAVAPGDYHNPTKTGRAWERPASAEFFRPAGDKDFQIDAGLRVHASDATRATLTTESKFSFSLSFRGDYGKTKLEFPLFPGSAVSSFDTFVLRGGHNDPENPFISDELMRRLWIDTGAVGSHGTFVNLFLNGQYWGYYNPVEHYDGDYFRAWYGSTNQWDVIKPFDEVPEGDEVDWFDLMNIAYSQSASNSSTFFEIANRLDLTNFVDYLLVNIYGDTHDWSLDNWVIAKERSPGARFRYYLWDAEFSLGIYSSPVDNDTIEDRNELGSTNEIATLFRTLRQNPEFRLLFADRVQKLFFHGGALTDANILRRFQELKATMAGVIPNMADYIPRLWVPQRRDVLLRQFREKQLLSPVEAPDFGQHGGRVRRGFNLIITAPAGRLYYTLDGSDPRVPVKGEVSPSALETTNRAVVTLTRTIQVKARTRNSQGVWSALTEATFSVAELASPVRITEIMYNPAGGDAYEFIELKNVGGAPVNLSGYSFEGVNFTFPANSVLPPDGVWVLSSAVNPAAFRTRYPDVVLAGSFGGALANNGEKLTLRNREGQAVFSVTYADRNGWPRAADGSGASLEIIDPEADPNDVANWQSSAAVGGTPGTLPQRLPAGSVRFNEFMAENISAVANAGTQPDWIELENVSGASIDLGGWSLSDDGNAGKFVFPFGTSISPGGFLVIWADRNFTAPGLHAGFALSRGGESLFLFDPNGERVDAISFGLQVPDTSVGRVGGTWVLTVPTPGAANRAAPTANRLLINEWLANPPAGEDDWIELYNPGNVPVALRGDFLTTSNAAFQIGSLSFVPAGGFVQLLADASTGPDHVNLKLPAEGGTIALYDAGGVLLDRVDYGPQTERVSMGRLPDGGTNLVSFTLSVSPGTNNYIPSYKGPVLNEIMAKNVSSVRDSAGQLADWVELFNPNPAPFSLAGNWLTTDPDEPDQWIFPAGVSIPANGYLVVWFDPAQPASTRVTTDLNTGHGLPADGGGVYLFNKTGQLVNQLEYGFQVPDLSIGRVSGQWRLLAGPTPGAVNAGAATLSSGSSLHINEWLANAPGGDDWFEIYNASARPVDLNGFFLSSDPSISGQTNFQIGPLSLIGGRSWIRWIADSSPRRLGNHVNFSLDKLGDTISIYSPSLTLVDRAEFGLQTAGVSEGHLPDATGAIGPFPTTSSPGAPNFLPLSVIINEVLTNPLFPMENAIELHNPTPVAVNISGWFLSDDERNFKKFRIPDGTIVPPRGYAVFYDYQFNPLGATNRIALNRARGGVVYLSQTDAAQNLTGYRAQARFGAAEAGISFGRYQTSSGEDFVALVQPTFGADNVSSPEAFRTGKGGQNREPRVGPVVLEEIMYHPGVAFAANEALGEYVELLNISAQTVSLADPARPGLSWHIRGGIEYEFKDGISLPSQGRLLLVGFDPATDGEALAAFQAIHSLPPGAQLVGPYRGRLNNGGDAIELYKPDAAETSGPDRGFIPYILVDRVVYHNDFPWPLEADGSGLSLQRRNSLAYGNDPANWVAAEPTPGAGRAALSDDTDGDGVPDSWELFYLMDPFNPADANDDPDKDGRSNREEFLRGSNPLDPASFLKIEQLRLDQDTVGLRFLAIAGESYSIQYRDSFTRGLWVKLADIPAQGVTQTVEVQDTVDGSTNSRFYRLVTPKLP